MSQWSGSLPSAPEEEAGEQAGVAVEGIIEMEARAEEEAGEEQAR
jgi:hypothetical protein